MVQLRGAGGTFPAALYEHWFAEIVRQRPDVQLKYDAVGSGAGVRLFTDELVDFGASDEAMSDDSIARVDRGVRLLPMTSGGIALAYNLSDAKGNAIGDLRLSRKAYSDIYLGKITRWNDAEITRHNPDIVLPDLPIQVEYRLDSSGTTLAFTRHLSVASDEWRRGPGEGKSVEWPVGAGMPKDKGVLSAIRRIPGAIGNLSYAYATAENAPMAQLENASGAFVKPTAKSLEAALRSTGEIPADMRMSISDPIGPDAYPIVTYSWIMCYRPYDDPRRLALLKEVLTYGLKQGQQASRELGYVPLPDAIVSRALEVVETISLPQSAGEATTAAPAPAVDNDSSPLASPVTRSELVEELNQEDSPQSSEEDSIADDTAVELVRPEAGITVEESATVDNQPEVTPDEEDLDARDQPETPPETSEESRADATQDAPSQG